VSTSKEVDNAVEPSEQSKALSENIPGRLHRHVYGCSQPAANAIQKRYRCDGYALPFTMSEPILPVSQACYPSKLECLSSWFRKGYDFGKTISMFCHPERK
jgi:hypothetical protein